MVLVILLHLCFFNELMISLRYTRVQFEWRIGYILMREGKLSNFLEKLNFMDK